MSGGRRPVRRTAVAARLRALYDRVPAVACKGDCWDACTTFPLPRVEKRRLAAEAGAVFPPEPAGPDGKLPRCQLLTADNRCSVYEIRPLVCRLWGVSDASPCNFGCVPEGGRLSVVETYDLLAEVFEISGQDAQAARYRRVGREVDPARVEALTPLLQAMARGLPLEAAVVLRDLLGLGAASEEGAPR